MMLRYLDLGQESSWMLLGLLGLIGIWILPGPQKYVKNNGLYGWYYWFRAMILHTFGVKVGLIRKHGLWRDCRFCSKYRVYGDNGRRGKRGLRGIVGLRFHCVD